MQHIPLASASQEPCEDGSCYAPVAKPRSSPGRPPATATDGCSGTRRADRSLIAFQLSGRTVVRLSIAANLLGPITKRSMCLLMSRSARRKCDLDALGATALIAPSRRLPPRSLLLLTTSPFGNDRPRLMGVGGTTARNGGRRLRETRCRHSLRNAIDTSIDLSRGDMRVRCGLVRIEHRGKAGVGPFQ